VVFHLVHADEDLAELVRALPYVKTVQEVDNKLVVTLDEPEQRNPEIIRLLVGAGAELQFVGEVRHSLEDVYLNLIKKSR
jgi:ABC-2 type transport system ATP-binding protein